MLGTIDIMLITKNAESHILVQLFDSSFPHVYDIVDVPYGHSGTGNDWQANSSGETLVTLRVIVLEADLEFDSLKEISLLGLERVLEELLDVGTHSGCGAQRLLVFHSFHADQGVGSEYRTDCDFRHDDSLPVESRDLMVRICVMFVERSRFGGSQNSNTVCGQRGRFSELIT